MDSYSIRNDVWGIYLLEIKKDKIEGLGQSYDGSR